MNIRPPTPPPTDESLLLEVEAFLRLIAPRVPLYGESGQPVYSECLRLSCELRKVALRDRVGRYFAALRVNPNHHLGSGDIRLTLAMQDQVIQMFAGTINKP